MRVKERLKRYLAMLLAIAMLMTSSSMGVLAEGMNAEPEIMTTAETQSETSAPETQPATATETQPETPAPETQPATTAETAAPETQPATAVETQPETPAPETQPATTAETAAPETQPAITEAVTDTEKASETQKPEDTEKATEEKTNETEVRKNLVTFTTGETSYVTVDDKRIQNNKAYALDGVIKFKVIVNDGYHLENVIVDGTTELTPENGIYTIHYIQTDATIVEVKTAENPQTEAESETEALIEEQTEVESETESETETETDDPEDEEDIATEDLMALLGADMPSVMSLNPDDQQERQIKVKFSVNGVVDENLSQLVRIKGTEVLKGLNTPETPRMENDQEFLGWKDGKGNDFVNPQDNLTAFLNAVGSADEITYEAQINTIYYVYFMSSADEDAYVVYTGVCDNNNDTITAYENYEPQGARVEKWKSEDGSEYEPGASIQVNASVKLIPEMVECYWLTFNTLGGSMIQSRYVDNGSSITLSEIEKPTRAGYSFAGWSTTADGQNLVSTIQPSGDMILYASWSPSDTNYTVVYWTENADDEDYAAVATAEKKGKTGEQITLNKTTGSLPNSVSDRNCFTFSKSDTVILAADGTSVINVYFSRNLYKITFTNLPKKPNTYVVERKYDSDISDVWKNNPIKDTLDGNTWYQSSLTQKYYVFLQKMPGQNVTMDKKSLSGMTEYHWYYYLETIDGTAATAPAGSKTITYQGKTYYEYADSFLKGYRLSLTYDEDYFPITGFVQKYDKNENGWNKGKFNAWTSSGSFERTTNLYYERVSYDLTFNNYSDQRTEKVRYEASIANKQYTPSRPNSVPETAEFKGWYTVPVAQITDSTIPYNFTGKTMPANDLVLYAYWKVPEIDVAVDATVRVGDGDGIFNFSIPYGTSIAEAPEYQDVLKHIEENGKTVVKWIDENGNKVDINQPLAKGINVTAVFAGEIYHIQYELGPGTGEITDAKTYATGSFASVKQFTETAPEGQVFVMWKGSDGKKYYPGDKAEFIKSDITLTAEYADNQIDKATLRYEANNETPQNKTEEHFDNERVSLIDNPFEYEGYEFTGWNTQMDGSGTDYSAGNVVRVENATTLFAQWRYSKPVTVKTTGGEYTYDGIAHGATVEVSGLPEKGYTVETATSDATATDVTEVPVKATCDTLVIKNAKDEDVTSQLNIKKVDGSITVNPATLEVTTPDATKVYDGTALTAAGEIKGFVNGETATFATTGTQTEVGESNNTYSLTWDGTAKEDNYTISATLGKLTVTEYADEIVVTTTGGTFTYDGKAHGASVGVSTLPTGYKVETATSSATATNVTKTPVAATCDTLVIKNAAGKDVTEKLKKNIKYVDGSITVNPATLEVTTPDATKVYDGTALTAAGEIKGFVNGETATFATTGTQTEVGESNNTYSLTWDGTAKEDNYTISSTLGKLTVTEYAGEIVVTTTGGEFTYDGIAHGATVEVSELPTGYTLDKATSSATATDVTTAEVPATCDTLVIKNAKGEDVTSQLTIKKVDGSITVKPAELTVSTPTATKVYDGTALTAEGEIEGFVNGETATFTTTGSQTEVGTSENTYAIDWEAETTTAKESNYTIKETIGKLTVTEYAGEIVVTTTGGEFTYDGIAHGATVEVSELPTGYTLDKATSSATATDVTTAEVPATCDTLVIKNAKGEDVTSQLTIKKVDGSITVKPAELTVSTPTATKVYDGTALTAEGEIEGFVNGETATFTTTGSQTEVGTSENTYAIDWEAETTTAKESNYTIKETIGKLTVTEYAGEIVVTTTGGEFTYDGIAHGATVEVSELPTGYTLDKATSSATATDVTTAEVPATCDTLVIKNAKGEDVTSQLTIKKVDGSITVKPAELTVSTPTATKVYDGTALTAEGEIEGFVNGETATFTTTGSQTEVGTSENTYAIDWEAETTTAKESNYTIKETIGKLTVTEYAGEIVVTTTGGEFTYDGIAHGATVEVSELPTGYTLDKATSSATATDVTTAEVPATCDTLVIKNAKGEDVTSQLTIKKVDGSITVKPAELTVSTPTATKVYDGTALTAEGEIEGFVNGETATFTTTGSQTEVGTSENTYAIDWEAETTTAKESNYTIKETIGKLTVTEYAGEIVVTTTGGEFTYDGIAHGATVEVSELPTGYTLDKATSSATATDVTEVPVKATCDMLVIKNEAEKDVTAKLKITYVDGSITVKPAELTIKVKNKLEQEYSGEVIKADQDGYTVIGNLGINEVLVVDEITGGQKFVGYYDDEYTIEKDNIHIEYRMQSKARRSALLANPAPKAVDPLKNYSLKIEPGDLEIIGDQVIPKKATPEVESNYKLGAEIPFTITVENVFKDTLENVTVTDNLAVIVDGDGYTKNGNHEAIIASIGSGDKVEVNAVHVVTEKDILAGTVGNTATVKVGDKTFEVNAEAKDIEDSNGHLTVGKETTSKPKDEKGYALGEEITYKVTVTNDGNLTITDITVTDELTGNAGDAAWKIEALAPGESKEFTASYTVTEKDILAGTVKNEATATGISPDPDKPEVPTDPGKTEDKTEDKSSELTISKEITNTDAAVDGKYPIGETIRYEIRIQNSGNLTLTNVTAEDVLTANEGAPAGTVVLTAGEGYTVTGTVITIEKLAPGEEMVIPAAYVVQEEDAGKTLVNVATGKADTPDTDVKDPIDDSSDPVQAVIADQEEPDEDTDIGKITVHKSVTRNGKASPVNDTIYVALFNEDGEIAEGTKPQAISLVNASDGETTFKNLPSEDVTYKVVEVNKKGEPVKAGEDGFKYSKILYSGQEVTLTMEKATAKASIENQLPAEAAAPKKDAVKTGDDTNTLMYWIILAMAAVAMSGSFAYRKKRKIR